MPLTKNMGDKQRIRFIERTSKTPPRVVARGASISIVGSPPPIAPRSPYWADNATRPVDTVKRGQASSAIYDPSYYTRTSEMFTPVEPTTPPMLVLPKKRVKMVNDGRLLRRQKPVTAGGSNLLQSIYTPTGKKLVVMPEVVGQKNMGMTEKLYDDRLSSRVFSTGGGTAIGAAAGASSCGASALDNGLLFFCLAVTTGAVIGLLRSYRNGA